MKVGEAASWGGPVRMVLSALTFMQNIFQDLVGCISLCAVAKETGGRRDGGRAGAGG